MRYQVTTPLTPREALEQALADFGPGGLGLQRMSQTNLSLVFQGGGGHIAVTAEPGATTTLEIETREETVAGILRLVWTGRACPFLLPVQPFSEESQRCLDRADTCQTPPRASSDVHALPAPQIVAYERNHAHTPCPRCGHFAYRHQWDHRTLYALGDLSPDRPVELLVTYSSHYCGRCQKHCNIDLPDVAPPGAHDTPRVIDLAVRVVVEEGLPSRPASWHLWRDHRVFVPFGTIQHWVEAGGKRHKST